MSDVASEYVRGLVRRKTGPDGKPMSSAELRVLKVLAWQHNEYVRCAWPRLRSLADEVNMSPTHARRTLSQLVERGVLRRFFATSERWGEATSNEYEFVALGEGNVSQETRDMVFKYRRVRQPVQVPLRRGGRKSGPVVTAAALDLRDKAVFCPTMEMEDRRKWQDAERDALTLPETGFSVAGVQGKWQAGECAPTVPESAPAAVSSAVEMVGGGNHHGWGGQPPWLPVELERELDCEVLPPVVPRGGAECAKAPAADAVVARPSAGHDKGLEATASARATATTSSTEAAVVSMERGGGSVLSSGAAADCSPGFRVGGRVVPFARKAERAALRPALDGEDAAFDAEARAVLLRCGVVADRGTRRMHGAIEGALRLYVERRGCTIADAGRVAVERWRQYAEAGRAGQLWRSVGMRAFFLEGYWLEDGRPWDFSRRAEEERSRAARASVGMRMGER